MSNLRIREIITGIYAISITESAINRMVLGMATQARTAVRADQKIGTPVPDMQRG